VINVKGILERFSNLMVPTGGPGPIAPVSFREAFAHRLEQLLLDRPIHSVLDFPCGEFAFTHLPHFDAVRYLGADPDPRVIDLNARRFGTPSVHFRCADFFGRELPGADLLLCRDVLNHLPNAMILDLLRQLGRFRYALFSYEKGGNEGRPDIHAEEGGLYAPLDLLQPPFSLPGQEWTDPSGRRAILLAQVGGAWPGAGPEFERLFNPGQEIEAGCPSVLVTIQGKPGAPVRPFFLECLEALDYPKDALHFHLPLGEGREALESWGERLRAQGNRVILDRRPGPPDAGLGEDDRFCLLADPETYLAPSVLRALVALDLPLVAPYLGHPEPDGQGGNVLGRDPEALAWIRSRRMRGILEVEAVVGTCLVRRDAWLRLAGGCRPDRQPQFLRSDLAALDGGGPYLDNRRVYGLRFSPACAWEAEQMLRGGLEPGLDGGPGTGREPRGTLRPTGS
jgi:SAM-dependent methyltransferase